MTQEYDNTNRGVLFQNERKETEKHPDYTGTINVDGVEHRLAGWKKLSKAGKPFLSLSLSEMVQKKEEPQQEVKQESGDEMVNVNDIPF